MKLLIVAATEFEITPLRSYFDGKPALNTECTFLITGVGMQATTYSLTRHLAQNKYDFLLQAGVGGSFDHDIALGSLTFVASEMFGDLGAEDHDKYLDLFELGLLDENQDPFSSKKLLTRAHPLHYKVDLPRVSGLTINTVSGSECTIKLRREKYGCQVESMEGAAFHYVCLQEKIPFAQIRAISNYVIPRDKSQWMMKGAIINLNNWLISFIETM